MTLPRGLRSIRRSAFLLVVLSTLISVRSGPEVFAVELSDMPVEIEAAAATANVMLIVDDAAIMDAEMLTQDSRGLFQGRAYLFPPSAYTPTADHVLGQGYEFTPDQRCDWRAQWHGYNFIFYNPNRFYFPWPHTDRWDFKPADLCQPLSDPARSESGESTLRLAAPFFNIISNHVSIEIPVAHYFNIDDVNRNGRWDISEPIVLVTWVDADRDGRLEISPDPNTDRRHYYRFVDDGDYVVEDDELIAITEQSQIDRIRPAFFSLSGNRFRFKSDQEDLQNFANWVTYYRSRKLMVKGLAAWIIAGLKETHAGLFPVGGSPAATAAEPVKPARGNVIVADDLDPAFATIGAWSAFNSPAAFGGTSIISEQEGAVAVFRPDLPTGGSYEVAVWGPCANPQEGDVPIIIGFEDSETSVRLSLSQFKDGPYGCGQWLPLGIWEMPAGGATTVSIVCPRNGQPVLADAVRFQKMQADQKTLDHTEELLNRLYALNNQGTKRLRSALEQVGRYFDDRQTSPMGPSPLADAQNGGQCQSNVAVMVSDGIWDDPFLGGGNADGNQGAPYADAFSDTLADVAMRYYLNDLSPALPDLIPALGCDAAAHQHMVTHTVGLGGRGRIDPGDIDGDDLRDIPGYDLDHCFADPDSPHPQWPRPIADEASCIDDYWHAAVNGRGIFAAQSGINKVLDDISRLNSVVRAQTVFGQPVISAAQVKDQAVVYRTSYDSGTWGGDVRAYTMESNADLVDPDQDSALWSASEQLEQMRDDPDARRITTYGGGGIQASGRPFRYADLSEMQKKSLGSDLVPNSTAELRALALVDYIRGLDSKPFRCRSQVLGDIVHSFPLVVGQTLYVGANDGMLHAFDKASGRERFAYIPHGVVGRLMDLAAIDYPSRHRAFVDAIPSVGDVLVDQYKRHTYLVGGYGKGGQGYYCLLLRRQMRTVEGGEFGPYEDVFNIDSEDEASERDLCSMVRWEYPRPESAADGMDNDLDRQQDELGEYDPDLGYSLGQGYAVNGNVPGEGQFRPVVIFPNGYNSPRGRAVLYILDAISGKLIRKIDTGANGDNGLSIPALIDTDFDRRIDYAYAGDLLGNLWKFDLTAGSPDQWGVAYGVDRNGDGLIDASQGDSPWPLFSAENQPITARPDVIFARNACAPDAPGYLVLFGTGRFLGVSDRKNVYPQSIYGIWDYGDDSDDSEVLGRITNRSSGDLSCGLRLIPQVVDSQTLEDGITRRQLSANVVDYRTLEDISDGDGVAANNTDRDPQPDPFHDAGWFLDFPSAPHPDADPGERVVSDVMIRNGTAIIISYVPANQPCQTAGGSWIYLVSSCASFPTSQANGSDGDDRNLQIQTGRRFMGRLGPHPLVYKQISSLSLDQLLVSEASGQILTIPFHGEIWGKVHWRQNSP
jgi:hypothetical protein